jgi:Predicted membrane protein
VGPFDLKSALLARHAQHVVLIHFPIALFLASVAFDMVSHWTKQPILAAVAYYDLLLAALSSVPVDMTGLLAWRWQLEGQRLQGLLLLHLVLGVASSLLIVLVWWLHFRARRGVGRLVARYRLPIELLAALIVGLTAHVGGYLSGVNGPG